MMDKSDWPKTVPVDNERLNTVCETCGVSHRGPCDERDIVARQRATSLERAAVPRNL